MQTAFFFGFFHFTLHRETLIFISTPLGYFASNCDSHRLNVGWVLRNIRQERLGQGQCDE